MKFFAKGNQLQIIHGAHDILPEIVDQLREKGRSDISVIAGGTIPDEDILRKYRGNVGGISEIRTKAEILLVE